MATSFYSGSNISIAEYDAVFCNYAINNVPFGNMPTLDINWINNDSFTLLKRTNNVVMLQNGTSTEDEFIFSLPSYDQHSIKEYMTHNEGNYQGFAVPPEQQSNWLFSASISTNMLSIKQPVIEEYLTHSEVDALMQRTKNTKRVNIPVDDLNTVSYLSSLLLNQANKQTLPVAEINAQLETLAFQTMLLPSFEVTKRRNKNSRTLAKAISFIRENFHKKIYLAQIAKYSNTTSRNLQIIFKEELGITPIEYINYFRLYQFHRLLDKEQMISRTAYQCGFTHMGRVSTFFKQVFGVTPSQYVEHPKNKGLVSWFDDITKLKFFA